MSAVAARQPPAPVAEARRPRRLPLNYMLEAAARVSFAYLRDQYGFRASRPLGRFVRRNLDFLAAARRARLVEGRMGDLHVLLPTADRTLARSVYASGDWDPLLVGTVYEALARAGRDVRGTVFLEVGANFGVYSLPAVAGRGFSRAIAYEPDPGAYALLVDNIRRNRLAARVSAANAALSDRPGELLLARSPSNAGDNRIVGPADGGSGDRLVSVPAVTFDDEVAAGSIPLDELGLVWIDVQGHEAQVLAGAASLRAADVPVVIEYSSRMMAAADRRRLDEMIADSYDALVDLGWSALTARLSFQPAAAIRRLVPHGRPLDTDLLLLKRG